MARRSRLIATVAAIWVIPAIAQAGGWAVTALDEYPDEPVAGETLDIGYTILQHGRTPVSVDETEIRIRHRDTGTVVVVPGVPAATVGRYTAEVTFPHSGEYEWEILQGGFGWHPLGAIDVAVARGDTPSSAGRLVVGGAMLVAALVAVLVAQSAGRRGQGGMAVEPR